MTRGGPARDDIREQRRQPSVHGFLFAPDLRLEDFEAIAHRHDRARLDEQGRSAAAGGVDDARKALVRV